MNEIYKVRWYKNFFVYTTMDLDNNPTCSVQYFIISEYRNDIAKMLNHLEVVKNQVGFGNETFDYFVLHYIIESREVLSNSSNGAILDSIGNFIKQLYLEENLDRLYSQKRYMSQLDMERFWGFKIAGRNIDLTDLKISLGMNDASNTVIQYKVEDSLYPQIIRECEADLKTIRKIYFMAMGNSDYENYSGINLISAQYKLSEEAGVPQNNFTPSAFAIKYFINMYRTNGGKFGEELKTSNDIDIKRSIPFYADFKSYVLKNLVERIKNSKDNKISESIAYNGIVLKFGAGGVHGCSSPGRYRSSEDSIIVDLDICSMYASIAVALGIKPRHMDEAFTKTMKDIVKRRFSCFNGRTDVDRGICVLTKTILNYIYGKTKELGGIIYDPQYSLDVTVAAQLFMAKFLENLKEEIPEIAFLMVNTDSITFKIPKKKKDGVFSAFIKMKQIIPFLRIKLKTYDILYIKDVNNYLGRCNDEVIAKGVFDYKVDIYKDNNKLIIPKCVKAFLVDGLPVANIMDEANITDYICKAKSKDRLYFQFMQYIHNQTSIDKYVIQNPSRYFYSETYKQSGRIIEEKKDVANGYNSLVDNNPVTVCNTIPSDLPAINKIYYRQKISELIGEVNITPNNGLLF